MSPISPGTKIRDLRRARNCSIELAAAEADITTLALSNIELKGAKPQRENLLKILSYLDFITPIPFAERRELLGAFGYLDTPSLPHALDVEQAVAAWQEPFKNAQFPSYIADYAQRIHDWNNLALLLIGPTAESLKEITVFDLLFSPAARGNVRLLNEEEVVTKMIGDMWLEFQEFKDEPWCIECLQAARQKYPLFSQLYDSCAGRSQKATMDIRGMEPIILADKEGNAMRFSLVATDLVSDPRFRVIQYIPQDQASAGLLARLIK